MKRMSKYLLSSILLLFVIFAATDKTYAQSEGNRLAFGFNAGMVKYWGEFTDNQFWLGGDIFLRYNILPWFSINGMFDLGWMRHKNDEKIIAKNPEYYGVGAKLGDPYPNSGIKPTIQEKNQTWFIAYGLTGSVNLFPSQSFVPYLFGGVAMMNFEPKSGDTGYDNDLPNKVKGLYDTKEMVYPLGLGFEAYITDNLVLNGKATYWILNTDWFDDYAKAGTGDDQLLTFGVGFSYYILGETDYDKDGLTNDYEKQIGTDPKNPDTDGDGLNDGEEDQTYKSNPLKQDTDGDMLSDYEEVMTHKTSPIIPDTDKDGLNDGDEVARKTNPVETDTDKDGIIDGDEINKFSTDPLKLDSDGDEVPDGDEVTKYNTNPKAQDSDGDGLNDGYEINTSKSNPLSADSDGDKLKDGQEINEYKTDPNKADTDGDGLLDGSEVLEYSTSPLKADTDGDKLNDREEIMKAKTDPLNPDSDKDNWTDGYEVATSRTDPNNPDTDGDKVIDSEDDCPFVKGVPSTEPGKNGCTQPPKVGTKTDFPDILFKVNSDEFNFDVPATAISLVKVLEYINQCEGLGVVVEGHASQEGNPKRNQELSDLRAAKVKQWLIEQGVKPEKISGTVGYGSTQPKIKEPTGKELKKTSKEALEEIRKKNRRITVKVVKTCS